VTASFHIYGSLVMYMGLFSHLWVSFHNYGSLFTYMGLFSHVWVSFHIYGSLFTCMGLFSHLWVSFHIYGSLSMHMGLFSCIWFPRTSLLSCICVFFFKVSFHEYGSHFSMNVTATSTRVNVSFRVYWSHFMYAGLFPCVWVSR